MGSKENTRREHQRNSEERPEENRNMAAYSSASNSDMCHGRDTRWEPMMESGGRRWMKAAPTFLPVFEPSEKGRTSLSDGGEVKDPV